MVVGVDLSWALSVEVRSSSYGKASIEGCAFVEDTTDTSTESTSGTPTDDATGGSVTTDEITTEEQLEEFDGWAIIRAAHAQRWRRFE